MIYSTPFKKISEIDCSRPELRTSDHANLTTALPRPLRSSQKKRCSFDDYANNRKRLIHASSGRCFARTKPSSFGNRGRRCGANGLKKPIPPTARRYLKQGKLVRSKRWRWGPGTKQECIRSPPGMVQCLENP